MRLCEPEQGLAPAGGLAASLAQASRGHCLPFRTPAGSGRVPSIMSKSYGNAPLPFFPPPDSTR